MNEISGVAGLGMLILIAYVAITFGLVIAAIATTDPPTDDVPNAVGSCETAP